MKQNKRYFNFSIVTYMNNEEILNFLTQYNEHIKHYAYALHDKDDNETHTHLLLMLYNNCTCSALRSRLSKYSTQNSLVQPLLDKYCAFQYLTHENNEDKAQYDKSIIKCDNLDFWEKLDGDFQEEEDTTIQIISDMLSGVPLYEMHKRYGRDFIINYHKYKEYVKDVKEEYCRNTKPYLVDEDGKKVILSTN